MESGGKLPAAEEIRYATICGSHANMAARAIFHGGLGLADLSLHEIPGEWRKAVADGCDWKVIKAVVWKEFWQDLMCQSGNTNQSMSKQEDELQLINKVKQAITSWPGASAPKWQDVSATVLRSRPKCGPCAPSIFAFVVRFGGSSKMLADTQAYARTCGKGGRELGQETWAILSQEMKSFPRPPPLETRAAEVCIQWGHADHSHGCRREAFFFISSRCCQCPCRLGMLLACSFLFKT